MKVFAGILAVVLAVGLALFAIFTFVVKPKNAAATTPPASQPAAAPVAAAPKAQPTDTTAQRLQGAADVIKAVGALSDSNLGFKLLS